MSAEQLLQAPDLGRCELLRGELVMMTPAGFEHGRIAGAITGLLIDFVKQHSLGVVTGGKTGFQIASDPDTVRAPDAAFIRSQRIPSGPIPGFFQGAPDLAIEVLSPGDRASEVLFKVQEWLATGCGAVWLVDPKNRTISVYRSRTQIEVLEASDTLSGGDILPGFQVSVAEIFAS